MVWIDRAVNFVFYFFSIGFRWWPGIINRDWLYRCTSAPDSSIRDRRRWWWQAVAHGGIAICTGKLYIACDIVDEMLKKCVVIRPVSESASQPASRRHHTARYTVLTFAVQAWHISNHFPRKQKAPMRYSIHGIGFALVSLALVFGIEAVLSSTHSAFRAHAYHQSERVAGRGINRKVVKIYWPGSPSPPKL